MRAAVRVNLRRGVVLEENDELAGRLEIFSGKGLNVNSRQPGGKHPGKRGRLFRRER